MAQTSVLEQGLARYVWDGEETIGLFERCTLRERLTNWRRARGTREPERRERGGSV